MSEKDTTTSGAQKKSYVPVMVLGIVVFAIVAGLQWASKHNVQLPKKSTSSGDVTTIDATDDKQWAYFVGYALAQQAKQMMDVDQPDEYSGNITAGVKDGLADEQPRFSDDVVTKILETRQEVSQERLLQKAQENEKKGEEYLVTYAQQDGVEKTQNGTLYKKLTEGEGDVVGDKVALVHYVGKHIDGKEFDSSARHGDQPVPFVASGIIPGLGEALKLMRVGDKWEIVIPIEGGYGKTPPPGSSIQPNEVLVFEIDVVDTQEAPKTTSPVTDQTTQGQN